MENAIDEYNEMESRIMCFRSIQGLDYIGLELETYDHYYLVDNLCVFRFHENSQGEKTFYIGGLFATNIAEGSKKGELPRAHLNRSTIICAYKPVNGLKDAYKKFIMGPIIAEKRNEKVVSIENKSGFE